MKLPYERCCIVAAAPIWYCKTCKICHKMLYVSTLDDIHYCDNCVPDNIRKKSVKVNQILEALEHEKTFEVRIEIDRKEKI